MSTYNCLCCNKVVKKSRTKLNKYCSNTCQREYDRINRWALLEAGDHSYSRQSIRTLFLWKYGNACQCCGLQKWLDKDLPVELDHKDGNPANNSITNLWLVCPNCHSVTDTWKGRNKGSGRKARGLELS